MMRVAYKIVIVLLVMVSAPISWAFQKEDEKEIPFQWLDTTGETSGVRFATKKLQPLSPKYEIGTPVEIKEEKEKINDQTTRITRRAYMDDINGNQQLIETVVEEIQRLPGDRVYAVRTTSRKDINGRFKPAQKEIQEIDPSGDNFCRTTRTLLLPKSGGGFTEAARVQQIERSSGDTKVEIERTRSEPDVNGNWSTRERRVSQNSLSGERTQSDEQVYQDDINNQMALTEQVKTKGWIDSNGQTHQASDSYTVSLGGELKLSTRTTIIQTAPENGRQEVTEMVESTNSANPGAGLKPIRKLVEDRQNLGGNETEVQLEVLEPGLNGGWENVYSEQSIEKK